MKRKLLLASFLIASGNLLHAQAVSTVTGLRLYEHHSHTIRGTQSANGIQSGYDFVSRSYFHSYNVANFGAYTGGEEANIDLVEHNGPYGNGQNGGKFGFTSGTSTIWVNEIKGNGTTKWMKAPASFSYDSLNDVSKIAAAYNGTTATQAIATVEENTVYLGRIRNSALYVALKTAAVKNKTAGDDDVYFDFEYKTGTVATASIGGVSVRPLLQAYPNPASDQVTLENITPQPLTAKLVTPNGQLVQTFSLAGAAVKTVSLNQFSAGLYFILCTAEDGQHYSFRFVKQ